jgi:hypothetical protein
MLPYVPAIMRKKPAMITKTFQATMARNCQVSSLCLLPQLSNNHMAPMTMRAMNVPKMAPMREMRELKTGIAEATMKEKRTQNPTQEL